MDHGLTRRRLVLSGLGLAGLGALGVLAACGSGEEGSSSGTGTGAGGGVPDPTGTLVTRWWEDPRSLGSYSILPPGARPADRAALAAPVGGVLFMAGEATAPDFPATVHGALLSGRRAARELLEAADGDETVVVIGAGAAGLGAARMLADEGMDVVVVEARERTGGRILTDDALGVPVDLGAAWIHGPDGNPLSDLVADQGLATTETLWDRASLHGPDGAPLDADEAAEVLDGLGEIMVLVDEEAGPDEPVGDVIARVAGEQGLDARERQLLEWAVTSEIEQEYAEDAEGLSIQALWEGSELEGGDQLPEGGYRAVVAPLAEGLDIRLGWPVETVSWGARGVTLAGPAGEIAADMVVCTLPLGVLRAGSVAFEPALPATTRAAIDALAMGVLDKCVLRFPEPFWDPSLHVIAWAAPDPSAFVAFVSLMPATGAPILVGLSAGSTARAGERLADSAIVARAMASLRAVDLR